MAKLALTLMCMALVASATARCDMTTTDCNTVLNKVPLVSAAATQTPTVETGLTAADKEAFEHLLGHALRSTAAVAWATKEFAKRMREFLVKGAILNSTGTTESAALLAAFASYKCNAHNTGYVGPFVPAIEAALSGGNIREVWGLAYVLTKTHQFSYLLEDLLPKHPPATLASLYGMNSSALSERWALVQATKGALGKLDPTGDLGYSDGVPDFAYEPFNSWVRFDFSAETLKKAPVWAGARADKKAGCNTAGLMSDDKSIAPPLSAAELKYQCNGTTPPCKLQWYPGQLCFDVLPVSFGNSSAGAPIPGYAQRAAALGYRTAAAASGTTSNMLQYARLLGFTSAELVLFRAAMAAWMLPTNDHSFFEIMLGAEPFMPAGFGMAMGMRDLGQLWPKGRDLPTAGGVFKASDLWAAVSTQLCSAQGKALTAKMTPDAKKALSTLVTCS